MSTTDLFMDATLVREIAALIAEAQKVKTAALSHLPKKVGAIAEDSGFEAMLADDKVFEREVPAEVKAALNALFTRIGSLPENERRFIGYSLNAASISSGYLKIYATRSPNLVAYPSVLNAVTGGLTLLDQLKKPSDIAFRNFYVMAHDLADAAYLCKETKEKPEDRLIRLRETMRGLFTNLDDRHKKVMNNALAIYQPLFFTYPGETPADAKARVDAERAGFRNGTRTIDTLMKEIFSNDAAIVSEAANNMLVATAVWPFSESKTLLSFDLDGDEVVNMAVGDGKPKPVFS